MTQAPGTVYDCLARNAIDSMLSAETSNKKQIDEMFDQAVETRVGYAFELVAVPVDNNCSCQADVDLNLSTALNTVATKLPVFPDYINSAYLAVQFPGIVGKVKQADQVGANNYKHTLEWQRLSGEGKPVEAAEPNAYPSVMPNDLCDADNSSLSFSGAGVKYDHSSREWVADSIETGEYKLKVGAALPIKVRPVQGSFAINHSTGVLTFINGAAIANTNAAVAPVSLPAAGPISIAFDASNGLTHTNSVGAWTDSASVAYIDWYPTIQDLQGGAATYSGAATGQKLSDASIVMPKFRVEIPMSAGAITANGGLGGSAHVVPTGSADGSPAGLALPSAAVPTHGSAKIHVLEAGRGFPPGAVINMRSGAVGNLYIPSSNAPTAPISTTLWTGDFLTENVPVTLQHSAFNQVRRSVAPAFGDLDWKTDSFKRTGTSTPYQWMKGDVVAVLPPTDKTTSLSAGGNGAPAFVTVLETDVDAPANKPISWVMLESAASKDKQDAINRHIVLTGGAIGVPKKGGGLNAVSGGFGFAPGHSSSTANTVFDSGTAWSDSGYSPSNDYSASLITPVFIPADEEKVDGFNISETDNAATVKQSRVGSVTGRVVADSVGVFTVRQDASFRRSYRCVPDTEAIRDGLAFEAPSALSDHSASDMNLPANPIDGGLAGLNVPLQAPDLDSSGNHVIARLVRQASHNGAATQFTNANLKVYGNIGYADPSAAARRARPLASQPYAHWVRGAVTRLVEKCNFYTGQTETNTMDQHDWVTMFAFEELQGHEGNRDGQIGGRDHRDREELIRASQQDHFEYVRLPFFFTLDDSHALNVINNNWSDYMMKWTMAAHKRLIVKSHPAVEVFRSVSSRNEVLVGNKLSGNSYDPAASLLQLAPKRSFVKPSSSQAINQNNNGVLRVKGYVILGCVYLNQEAQSKMVEDGSTEDDAEMRAARGAALCEDRSCSGGSGKYKDGRVDASRYGEVACSDNSDTTKAYMQTLHHWKKKDSKDEKINIKIVGSHPVCEFILLFQVADNGYTNDWMNFGSTVAPMFTLGQSAGPDTNSVIDSVYSLPASQQASTQNHPRGFSGKATTVSQNDALNGQPLCSLQDPQGPVDWIELKANNNTRITKAPGSHFCKLVPHMMHSQSPDLKNNAFVYALPLSSEPEEVDAWSGSLNQGRLTNINITVNFSEAAKNLQLACHVIQRTWNIRTTTDESQGGAKYSNQATVEISSA
jgi:hypothetical protein